MEVKCPYTKPTGGAQRFGGWTNAGRKQFNDLVLLVEKNRKDRKKYLTHVEQAALDQIRAHHNCDEREAKRKKKKSKVDDEDDKIDCGVPISKGSQFAGFLVNVFVRVCSLFASFPTFSVEPAARFIYLA